MVFTVNEVPLLIEALAPNTILSAIGNTMDVPLLMEALAPNTILSAIENTNDASLLMVALSPNETSVAAGNTIDPVAVNVARSANTTVVAGMFMAPPSIHDAPAFISKETNEGGNDTGTDNERDKLIDDDGDSIIEFKF